MIILKTRSETVQGRDTSRIWVIPLYQRDSSYPQKIARDVRHGNFPLQMARMRLDRIHSEMRAGVRIRRMLARQTLDALPDFPIGASGVSFKQSFMEIESDETFFSAPKTLVDACRSILTLDINTAVDRVVHDNVTVQIGCDHVPPFALVNGWRDRIVFPLMRLRRLSCFSVFQKIAGSGNSSG